MDGHKSKPKFVSLLQDFSIPLIFGVFVALICANFDNHLYHTLTHTPIHKIPAALSQGHHGDGDHDHHEESAGESESHDSGHDSAGGDDHNGGDAGEGEGEGDGHEDHAGDAGEHGDDGHHSGLDHYLTLHFLVNDIFMVIFFGIAAKEITESLLPGGALNPMRKAINPLLGTLGGVLGPVGAFFLFNAMMGRPEWSKGWGIPTATDIALAWLVARVVFGKGHPAISFLLLLAVADDGIGLGIIAFAYPDPLNPVEWGNTIWILPGMALAYILRRMKIRSWIPYILFGGLFSWYGLYSAHLHPALALVFIVPFLPGPKADLGFYREDADYDSAGHHGHSPLENFEHDLKMFVDFGLFFFSFANAGVPFSGINSLTWIVLLSLVVGKTVGITAFSWGGQLIGFPLPQGMKLKHLVGAGIVAGLGLTVALFVAGQAYTDPGAQGAAKMGALFSGFVFILAMTYGKIAKLKD